MRWNGDGEDRSEAQDEAEEVPALPRQTSPIWELPQSARLVQPGAAGPVEYGLGDAPESDPIALIRGRCSGQPRHVPIAQARPVTLNVLDQQPRFLSVRKAREEDGNAYT